MKRIRKALAVFALGATCTGAWIVGDKLVGNVQFARAAQDVENARRELAQAPELTNVYRQIAKVVEPSVVVTTVSSSFPAG